MSSSGSQLTITNDLPDQHGRASSGAPRQPGSVVRVRRQRADSHNTIIDSPYLRALSGPAYTFVAPSPLTQPVPDMSNGLVPDESIPFIPLLGPSTQSSTSPVSPSPPVSRPTWLNAPRTDKRLTQLRFTDDMLLDHIRKTDFSEEMRSLLKDALSRKSDIDLAMSFRDFAASEREGYVSSTFEVYDVAADATVKKISIDLGVANTVNYTDGPFDSPDGIVDASLVWKTIKDVNTDDQSVGRITIVQEPTPLVLAALHLSMSPHFDMSELLHHLLTDSSNRGRTHAFIHRAFERQMSETQIPGRACPSSQNLASHSPSVSVPPDVSFDYLRQRSFFFVFKYYTVVGDGLEPAFWQRYDKRPLDKRTGDHIDIAECSSVLALSLEGSYTKKVTLPRRRGRPFDGYFFDTFGPWHLLNIQSFPDDQHTVRTKDIFSSKTFYNGPLAFLDFLVVEYRDAVKRNQILHERISKLITPPTSFMFDRSLRDKLLFEDSNFTYIRRYFWSYNTLGVINTGIKAMIAAYHDTFTDDFWAGTNPWIWPHPDPGSPEGVEYTERLLAPRRELDKVVAELGEVLKRNERTRKEIESLREQLFYGSSIYLSRQTIDQGRNVRILTTISMIFLPLTFVTSVFGITMFDIPPDDWRFAITMVLTCVPFMIIIGLFQTRTFNVLLNKLLSSLRSSLKHLSRLAILLSRLKESASSSPSGGGVGSGHGHGGTPRSRNHWPHLDDGPSSASELGLPPTAMRPPRGRKGDLLAFGLRSGGKADPEAGWWSRWWPFAHQTPGTRTSALQAEKCTEVTVDQA